MNLITDYQRFFESMVQVQKDLERPKGIYKPTNLVSEICTSMILINNEFLDNILDRGLKARYTENSQVFLTDLKNLVLGRNRLHLGTWNGETFVEDNETSKMNYLFESVGFDIDKDWNDLVDSRITARNIIDKLLPDQKLESDLIKSIFWIGPNKTKEITEDIVIELNDGRQFSIHLNKNLTTSKSASFNTFMDDLIGNEIERLFDEEYIQKWNKLVQSWVKIIYQNCNKNFKIHIEKFIDPSRIDTVGWFEYFDLKHRDPRFSNLGEHIREFDKNILWFSDFMNEIWKRRDVCFSNPNIVYKEWMETKIFILNSRILENLLTNSLVKNNLDEIRRLKDGLKGANGRTKMKLMKTFVEKIGAVERGLYYLGNKGNVFHHVPSRNFFREFYNDLRIKFDYHVKLVVKSEEEENDFIIKMFLELDKKPLINCIVNVKFSGGGLSEKLSAKYKFEFSDDFNFRISEKLKKGIVNED